MIKPAFWSHRMHDHISESAALLAVALLSYADDEGRFEANPGLMAKTLFPRRDLVMGVEEALEDLVRVRFIHLYEGELDGLPIELGCIPGFRRHQTINKSTPSSLPPPPDPLPEDYRSPTVVVQEDSGSDTVGLPPKGKERKGKEVPPKSPKGDGGEDSPPSKISEVGEKGGTPAERYSLAEMPSTQEIGIYCATAGIEESYATEWFQDWFEPKWIRDWQRKLSRSWRTYGPEWKRRKRRQSSGEEGALSDLEKTAAGRLRSIQAELDSISPEELQDPGVKERYRALHHEKTALTEKHPAAWSVNAPVLT